MSQAEVPEEVGNWLDDRKATTDSEASFQTRRSDINQYLKWLQAEGESFYPIEQERHKMLLHRFFLYMNSEGYARKTIAIRWNSIKILYDGLADFYSLFEETPFEDLYDRSYYLPKKTREETKSEKPYVTREQKELLCENVPSPSFRNEVMIRLMWQTGLREGEVATLRVEDVNLKENKLDRFWSPKISTERTVTFKDSLHWWVDEWINGGYRDSYPAASSSEYLFVTHQSEKMQNDRPTTIVVQAANDAGIQEIRKVDQRGREWNSITSHAVRRGHAMHLLKNGVDLRTIQKRLGHSKLETTIGYLPISPEDAGDQIEDITF